MKIAMVGTGYVGLVVGACLAETGNRVQCADVDQDKVDLLTGGRADASLVRPGATEAEIQGVFRSVEMLSVRSDEEESRVRYRAHLVPTLWRLSLDRRTRVGVRGSVHEDQGVALDDGDGSACRG